MAEFDDLRIISSNFGGNRFKKNCCANIAHNFIVINVSVLACNCNITLLQKSLNFYVIFMNNKSWKNY